jgi:hypothetical protein
MGIYVSFFKLNIYYSLFDCKFNFGLKIENSSTHFLLFAYYKFKILNITVNFNLVFYINGIIYFWVTMVYKFSMRKM